MKHTKRIFAIFLSLAMVMTMMIAMSATVFADETSQHTITITNTDQNVSHTYKGYQVFKGKLDANQQKLSDIDWGDDVDGAKLLAALKASTDSSLLGDNPATTDVVETDWNLFTSCSSAKDVAKVFATFSDTSAAAAASGAIDAVAKIIGETNGVLKTDGVDFTEGTGANAKSYTATVTGDGYYFVKDTTTTLTDSTTHGSDTLSKYLLAVVKDTTIVAKDTGLTPDKEIVSGNERVKTGTAAVGDTVTFEVKVKVPDTRKYVDHFVFDMQDKLPKGLTFTGITSVKVGSDDVSYDLYINDTKQTLPFVAPTDPVDEDAPTADNTFVKLVFTNFKTFAEAETGRIGANLVVTYTAVVNKNANFTSTGNINEVVFDYSNDPNHDYDGDTPGPNEPMGVTPKDTTKTLLTNITIHKQGDKGQVANLAGAEFEITSSDYNVTLVTGEKFEASPYTAKDGETIVDGDYYKLKDGSYTTTAPTEATASSYESTEDTYKKVTFSQAVTTPGTANKVTVISGEDGNIKLEGLKAGTYTIQEKKAPSGYNLDNTVYTIKLDFNGNAIVLNTTDSSEGVTYADNTATASLTIDNESGTVLPGTGGIGTVIFYVLGSALLIGCGVVLISKRRMTKEK